MEDKKTMEELELEYSKAKKGFVVDWLQFLQNDELQTMIFIMVLLVALRLTGLLDPTKFEEVLMVLFTSGFLADGLNKITNRG